MSEEAKRWSQPFAALLGAYDAQMGYGLPSIGGKDSMSGTFNDIDVPPTLVSFAVDISKKQNIISPELKKAGDKLVRFHIAKDEYDLPVYEDVMKTYDGILALMAQGVVRAAYALDAKGVAAAVSKMAFGNKLGVAIDKDLAKEELFTNGLGDIVAEMPADAVEKLAAGSLQYTVIGTVTEEAAFVYGDVKITMEEALKAWTWCSC